MMDATTSLPHAGPKISYSITLCCICHFWFNLWTIFIWIKQQTNYNKKKKWIKSHCFTLHSPSSLSTSFAALSVAMIAIRIHITTISAVAAAADDVADCVCDVMFTVQLHSLYTLNSVFVSTTSWNRMCCCAIEWTLTAACNCTNSIWNHITYSNLLSIGRRKREINHSHRHTRQTYEINQCWAVEVNRSIVMKNRRHDSTQ